MVGIYTYKICRLNVSGHNENSIDMKVNALAVDDWRIVSVAPDVNLDYYLITLERPHAKGKRS